MQVEEDLARRVARALGDGAPGVALVVVGPDGVRATAAVGLADLRARTPMTPDTAMPWFSMTKIATATTTMRLAREGVLQLDAPVAPLVPAMAALRPAGWAARITARHLLQHAAGIANPIPVSWIHAAGDAGPDPDAFLSRLLSRHAKLRFEPGTRSSYSNVGTLILGAAIARATARRFVDVVRDEVLEPVGMRSTGFAFADGTPAATGHHPARSPMRYLLPRWVRGETRGHWMALRRFLVDGAAYGGLVGTPNDAARFVRMHLRDGELDGSRVLATEDATAMRTIDARGRRFDLGLGWFVPVKQRGARPAFVEHLGAGAGFFNVMRIYPTERVAAVVMGNSTRYRIDDVASLALGFAGAR